MCLTFRVVTVDYRYVIDILLIVLFLYIDDKENVGMIRVFIFLIHCYY